MEKYNTITMCTIVGLDNCGICYKHYKVLPCNVVIPNYIPIEQVKDYIELKEKNYEKPKY